MGTRLYDGAADVERAADALASRLPEQLRPLAKLAFDLRWSWTAGGPELFRNIDPHRWALSAESPVRFLEQLGPRTCERLIADEAFTSEMQRILDDVSSARTGEPARQTAATTERPIAFLCTEFAVHGSLQIYSGGLGVLAGDILKESADLGLPYVGVGLFYRQGYFRQRMDASGWQHEYWTEEDPERLPAALVTGEDGRPLTITVPVRRREVTLQIWRVNVGRVPLYLLDAARRENHTIDRWITSRLYVSDRRYRLAQYAVLGLGGMRALRAMGYDPSVVHLNEGHVALAPLEMMRESVANGATFEEALEAARARTIFTTHTPVAAGNEAYSGHDVIEVLGDLPAELGADEKDVLGIGRARPESSDEPFGLTVVGLRLSRKSNGVSRLHGDVAREMWQHIYPGFDREDVPIGHVTNGVHGPTWIQPPMRALLDRVLGAGWERHASDRKLWDTFDSVSDADVWKVRCELRTQLVGYARERAIADRLARGEPAEYVEAATNAFDEDTLTVGFARRAVAYKRLYLLTLDPNRALRLLDGPRPIQLLIAGKPHPQDEDGKRILQRIFEFKWAPHVSDRVAFLEDYNLAMAGQLVGGCDVWLNVPRPPMEASGTSGMKSAMNGGLNCSVLDGWWAEAFDGSNGWGITSHPTPDLAAQDAMDANTMYDLLEHEIVPMFYDRDANGVPVRWVQRVKWSMRTIIPQFCATRMMDDYLTQRYEPR